MSFTFKTVYDQTKSALGEDPGRAAATFEAKSTQVDGFRSNVNVRQFAFGVDEPEALGGTDTAPNPVELVLAALASCQEITYRLYADGLGIPLKNVSVQVEGDVDLRGFFAVDPDVRAGFKEVVATVTLESDAPAEDLRRLKTVVDAHCPVLDILRNPVPTTVGLDIAKTGERASAA